MEALGFLLGGFAAALTPANLLFLLIGVLMGMVVGVLPGLGPTATMAILLPLTFTMEPTTAVIMLAGIYYGTMYGGTITAVLVNIPGEAAAVVTTLDGYQMARQGRAGPALGIAAIGSFVGGIFATGALIFVAPPLARVALRFGPPEIFVLTVIGISLVTLLGTRSLAKSLIMAAVGLIVATVGQDPIFGTTRFTLGTVQMLDGIDFVAVAMGLFGIGEILYNIENPEQTQNLSSDVGRVLPTREDLRVSRWPIARGSIIGTGVGVLPGGAGVIASLISYTVEKRRSKSPERFGKGAIEGVAGPETANNAASQATFIPLFTLGLPANSVLALLYGALLIQGITPGPRLIADHGDVFWGVVASMFLGNLMLLALNIPMVGIFIQMLRVHGGVLGSIVILITMVGVFAIANSVFDMWVAAVFGLLGYLMRKRGFEPGPLVLAYILGPMVERSFRQSLIIMDGNLLGFFQRPWAGSLIAIAVVLFSVSLVARRRQKRMDAELQETKSASPGQEPPRPG